MDHFEHHHKSDFENSALNVNCGVEQPPIVNPYFKKRKKRVLTVDDYIKGITEGNITILSRAITLIESLLPSDYDLSQEIIEKCLPYSGKSVRIGITGVPGAGKSTFIEAIGTKVTNMGHKLAVLAIDPSSEKSGGSILGDKTRMETLIQNKNAFIRPSPTAGSLGGVARKTRETIILCEAAGFDVIFIETVGVGQSETSVHSMVDLFLMLQIAGAGDELQGIKRGIMEMADMIGVTKADGENIHRASLAKAHFLNALNLFPMPKSGWKPRVYTCSSIEGNGLMELWGGIEDYMNFTKQNGYFESHRAQQSKYWMYETVNESLRTNFYRNEIVASKIKDLESKVIDNQISPFVAAKELLNGYLNFDE